MTAVQRTIKNLRDILTEEQTEILKIATLLMVPSLLTKITGQLVTVLVATKLGTGIEISDFNLANTIPEGMLNILLLGVVGVVVIPVFIESKERSQREFHRLYNTVFNVIIIIFALLTILVALFAGDVFPWMLDNIIRPVASEYPSAERVNNLVAMMRFLMLPNLILAASVLISSGLQVYNRLLVPHLAPLFYNLGRVFSVFVLLPLMDNSPWALVYGLLIGSIFHLIVQLPLTSMVGLKYEFILDLKDPAVRKLFRISIPRGFAYAAETIGLIVMRFLATAQGAITAFNYANSLALVVPTIFASSFAFASFPTLSTMYARKQYGEMSDIIARTVNQIFFLSIPFVVLLVILRLPVVRLVYGLLPNTAFTREDTLLVAWIVMFFSVGMLLEGLRWYLYRIFYVAQNTILPLAISLFTLVGTIVLGVLLSNLFSHGDGFSFWHLPMDPSLLFTRSDGNAAVGGLALAFSITSFIEVILQLYWIHRKVLKLNFALMFEGLVRKLVPTSAMTVLMYFMYKTWDTISFPIDAPEGFSGSTTFNLIVLTGITVFTCFMVYYLLCYLFRVEELKILRRLLNPLFRMGGLRI